MMPIDSQNDVSRKFRSVLYAPNNTTSLPRWKKWRTRSYSDMQSHISKECEYISVCVNIYTDVYSNLNSAHTVSMTHLLI